MANSAVGVEGAAGAAGPAGVTGATGPTGSPGRGATGVTGVTGVRRDRGYPGPGSATRYMVIPIPGGQAPDGSGHDQQPGHPRSGRSPLRRKLELAEGHPAVASFDPGTTSTGVDVPFPGDYSSGARSG